MSKTYDPKKVRLTFGGVEISGLSEMVHTVTSPPPTVSAPVTFTGRADLTVSHYVLDWDYVRKLYARHPKFGRGGRRNRKARRAAGRPS